MRPLILSPTVASENCPRSPRVTSCLKDCVFMNYINNSDSDDFRLAGHRSPLLPPTDPRIINTSALVLCRPSLLPLSGKVSMFTSLWQSISRRITGFRLGRGSSGRMREREHRELTVGAFTSSRSDSTFIDALGIATDHHYGTARCRRME